MNETVSDQEAKTQRQSRSSAFTFKDSDQIAMHLQLKYFMRVNTVSVAEWLQADVPILVRSSCEYEVDD